MRLSFEEKFFFHVSKNALLLKEEKQIPTTTDIVALVCGKFNIAIADIKSKRKLDKFAYPRQIAMYLIKKYFDISNERTGLIFLRDGSTVDYACKRIASYRGNYPNRNATVTQLEEQIERIFKV